MLSAMTQTSCILRQNNFELTIPAEAGKVCLHNLSNSPVLFPKEKDFANPPQQYTETEFRCNNMFTALGSDLYPPYNCPSSQAEIPVRILALEFLPEWPTCYGRFCPWRQNDHFWFLYIVGRIIGNEYRGFPDNSYLTRCDLNTDEIKTCQYQIRGSVYTDTNYG